MPLSKSDLEIWRDEIIDEMQRITKRPGSVATGGANLDNQHRMSVLTEQLITVNRLLALLDGAKALKVEGVDA